MDQKIYTFYTQEISVINLIIYFLIIEQYIFNIKTRWGIDWRVKGGENGGIKKMGGEVEAARKNSTKLDLSQNSTKTS